MANIALLFPGQGSQAINMGKDFYDEFPEAKAIFEKANNILGFSLTDLMFDGPEEELRKTENTQPALLVTSIAMLTAINQLVSINPIVCAGHSLGEFTAYVASGALAFNAGVLTVRKRGELMASADPEKKGTMAAIIGLDDALVEDLCKQSSDMGLVIPANYNCPGQVVISGEKPAVEKAIALAKEQKAKMAIQLQVSGAFHSPLIESASKKFESFLNGINIEEPKFPVISNVTAESVKKESIKASWVKQLQSSVQWKKSIETMLKMGVDTFIEIGSGKVLQGLVKKIDRKVTNLCINNLDTLKKTIEKLKQ